MNPIASSTLSNGNTPIALFSGRSNPALAAKIAEACGRSLGNCRIKNFADNEIHIAYGESIRNIDLFIIQSTPAPADHWMELFMLVDAARRSSASRITAVIPYFGYTRQDRKDQPRVSIAAKLCANMLVRSGVDRVLTMDLHAPQLQGFFDIPVDHIFGSRLFMRYMRKKNIQDLVVVAPDAGGAKRARAYATRLHCDMALIDKRRPSSNVAEVMHLMGSVEGKTAFLVDDMVDTAGTLVGAAQALRAGGAKRIYAACTHALLSGPAYERIESSYIDKILITDTVPLKRTSEKIEVLSVASYFAEAIQCIHTGTSLSTLFEE